MRLCFSPLSIFAATVAASACLSVHAQGQVQQQNWQTMNLAVFNSPYYESSASEAEVELARSIWKDEIASIPTSKERGKLPGFVLISSTEINGKQLIFSSLSGSGVCPPAPNGRSQVDIYGECPLKITLLSAGKATTRTVEGFCHLYGLHKDNPLSLNQTQFNFDPETGVAQFRVIQHGQLVPQCSQRIVVKE
ncbi:hypothetical protein E9531_14500 [Lampropedia puyangensis]|uniref:DUF3617 family protein n=1 Tax=Lampropedia puyangensis TaxID=1330072 RepID=A0A4S8EU57_9BURK|nr:hypothetical protein [Lampropedia puyangensis]THT98419.1 hypothetical protein E9531_14500 [Lampropedia puyangensis]